MRRYSATEKDKTLSEAFASLSSLGISSAWANSLQPYSDIEDECSKITLDTFFVKGLKEYFQNNPLLSKAVEMFFTYIAISARAKWDAVPNSMRPITARGWFLGRWIPTFLIIDGPIGRFFSKSDSPLFLCLKTKYRTYPMLASARDFLANSFFRRLRNGFGHWSFHWEVINGESSVVVYDWTDGSITARMTQKQADAFHIVTFAIIEVIEEWIIRPFANNS